MIKVSGDLLTDLYAKNMMSELFPEYCFSEDKNIECIVSTLSQQTHVTASLIVDGRKFSATERYCDHLNSRLATTTSIGKAIISFATSFSRKTPPYGVLTGVRPFKIAVDLLARFDYDEVINKLKNTYMVDSDKIELLLSAAMYDQKIRDLHKKNDASVYISIPFCPSRCNYCSFISSAAPSKLQLIDPYVNQLIKEIHCVADLVERNNINLKSIYIGGGTPTILSSKNLEKLLSEIDTSFSLTAVKEFTVEAGRPDTINSEKLDVMRSHCVTRTCVNCQSTDDKVLEQIGRGHTSDDFFKAFDLVRNYGFETINTDIIAGLDGDSIESFKKTVDDVLSLSPESITVHTLCVKKSSDIRTKDAADLGKDIDEYMDYSKNACILGGFLPYYLYKQKYSVGNHENVGYCLHSHECHYNIAMMNEIENIFGIGAGATSRIVGCNDNGKIDHLANYKYPTEYINGEEKVHSNLTLMDSLLKKV